jgi:hypothetical protein
LVFATSNTSWASADAVERARIDSTGNFCIAATAPGTGFTGPQLVVGKSANPYGLIEIQGNQTADGSAGLIIFYNAPAAGRIAQISVDRSGADNSGAIVFSTWNAGSGAQAGRFSKTGGFSVGTTSDPGTGGIYATGAITAFFSDKRLKTVSGKIENALDKVAKLSGVYYTLNDTAKSFGYDSDEEYVGVIAQEVEAVLPQIVKAAPFDLDENNNSKSGEHYKTVQYEKLVPLLIEAINELQAKVKLLENK